MRTGAVQNIPLRAGQAQELRHEGQKQNVALFGHIFSGDYFWCTGLKIRRTLTIALHGCLRMFTNRVCFDLMGSERRMSFAVLTAGDGRLGRLLGGHVLCCTKWLREQYI
jgi:hypothetical protein